MEDKLRLEWIDPATLDPNPRNWRRHPEAQARAMRVAVDEVGWAGALLYNEATGRLIDGHLRKDLYAGVSVPVLVGSWTEEQEAIILATLDPIAALAETNEPAWDALLADINGGIGDVSDEVLALLRSLDGQGDAQANAPADAGPELDQRDELREKWGAALGQLWELPSRVCDTGHRLRIASAAIAQITCDLAVYDPPFDWTARQQDAALSWCTWKNALLLGLAPCMPLAERADFRHWWVCDFNIARFGGKGYKPMSGCCLALAFGDKRRWNEAEALAVLDAHGISHYDWPVQIVEVQDSLWQREWGTYQKPVALMEYIVALYSFPGDIVGDPFAGAGGVLMACERLGRGYVGSEIDPSVAACALERYAKTFAVAPVLVEETTRSEETR